MFGNLIASIGLACAIGTPKIPNVQRASSNDNYISGTYCLKYIDEHEIYFSEPLFEHDVEIDFMTSGMVYNKCFGVYCGADASHYNHFDYLLSCTLFYDSSEDRVVLDVGFNYDYNFDDSNYPRTLVIYQNDDITDTDTSFSIFAISFTNFVYLNDEQDILFKTIFTNDLNANFVRYNGWYAFNNDINTIHGLGSINVISSCTFDNNIWNGFYYGSYSTNSLEFFNFSSTNGSHLYMQENNWFTNQRRVLLSPCVFTTADFTLLNRIGIFSYSNYESYDLADLFFNIGDTPAVFITSLFDFELFGINFALGFMSVLTVICMVFIIRKVI